MWSKMDKVEGNDRKNSIFKKMIGCTAEKPSEKKKTGRADVS